MGCGSLESPLSAATAHRYLTPGLVPHGTRRPCARSQLMIRNSYLALCRAMEAPVHPSAVALRVPLPPPVRRDPQRGLSGADEHDRARVLVGREPVDPGDHAMKTPR